jgi:Flp pilus assembly pilin Flp
MFARCLALMQQVNADSKGVTSLEYAVIGVIMVITVAAAIPNLGAALTGAFGAVAAAY